MAAALLLALSLVACGGDGSGPPAEPASAVSPFTVADSLRAEGRYPAALREYRRVRDSLRAAAGAPPPTGPEADALWRAEVWSAHAFVHVGEQDSAAAALAAAAALDGGESRRRARTRWVRSLWMDRRGRLDSARAEAEAARELAVSAGDVELEAAALNALGRIHSLAGRYREALEVHEAYLELQRRRGEPAAVALALNEIAIDYRHFGRFGEAIGAYREALEIYRRLGDREGMAMVLYNLANVRLDMGEREEALSNLSASLEHVRAIGHVYGRGLLHNNLARVHLEAGHLEDARRHLSRALSIHDEADLAYGAVVGRTLLGRLELEAGRPGAARRALDEALARAEEAELGRQRVAALTLLARVAARRGEAGEATGRAEAAVAAADSLRDPEARYEALVALARAREAAGREDRALAAYRRAIGLLESWRGRVALGDLRLGVAAPRMEAHEGAIRLLVEANRPAEAFRVAEGGRARLLLELMADRRPPPGSPDSRADSLRRALRDGYRRWREATVVERPGIEEELDGLAASLEALETGSGRPGLGLHPRPVGPAPVRRELVRPGAGLLAYFWGERDVFGWWVGGDRIEARRLGPADSLAATVGFLRGLLRDPDAGADWRPAARRLHRALVAPFSPGSADLLVIPDGALAGLPFEALLPAGADHPLGGNRRVTYGPSASVLLALARRRSDRARDGAEALAVGVSEPPPGGGDPAAGSPGAGSAAGDRAARRARLRPEPLPLPHAAEEARAVASLFEPAELLLGPRATRENLLAADPGRFRYLHFAAHARVDERRPDRTHLLLADGPLRLPGIRRLRLTAELVTLSACETGLGRRVPGEGVLGLTHAFLAAGARAVVVTLWRVRDPAAARFMEHFYRELRKGRAPADALRETRRFFLTADGADAHPARWAAFVLVGGASR